MSPTMKDVAIAAGLSLGTVSNYINGKKSVTKENGKKIEKAISTLGYQVNIVARSLKTKSFHTIGVLVPTFKNVYLIRIVSIIEELLREAGYAMMVASYHGEPECGKHHLEMLATKVDGIIYVPSQSEESAWITRLQERVPIVMLNEKLENVVADSVLINNYEIAYTAISSLLSRGYQKIAVIAGHAGDYTTKQRVLGCLQAHMDKQHPVSKDCIIYSNYSKSEAEKICKRVLTESPDVDSFFVVGNRMTLGVLSALRELKIKKGIIGFDLEDIEDALNVPVCFVSQPCEQLANMVVELILKRVRKEMVNFPTSITLAATLINESSLGGNV